MLTALKQSILTVMFPRQTLTLEPDSMATVLEYHNRVARSADFDSLDAQESSCGPVSRMQLVADATNGSQVFVSTGRHIFEVTNRAVHSAENVKFPQHYYAVGE